MANSSKGYSRRTLSSADMVTQALKARWAAQKAAAQAYRQEQATKQMMRPAIQSSPARIKASAPMPPVGPGGARDEARTGAHAAFLKQVHHAETGCVTVHPETAKGQATLRRLANSALNANTTQGNYTTTHTTLHK